MYKQTLISLRTSAPGLGAPPALVSASHQSLLEKQASTLRSTHPNWVPVKVSREGEDERRPTDQITHRMQRALSKTWLPSSRV